MTQLVLEPTPLAQWQALIAEASQARHFHLNEDQESYLVFLLMRFLGRTEMVSSVLALEFLNGLSLNGQVGCERLRDVGDQCLLVSGLFPNRAERKRVKVSYFVQLGRSAYTQASQLGNPGLGSLFGLLAKDFVALMDVLQAVRALGTKQPVLEPLNAFELWQDTGSQMARITVQEATTRDAAPFVPPTDSKH